MHVYKKIDAWEQRKLGDVSNYIKGFAFKSKDYKKDGVRIIQVSDLTKDKIKCSNTNIFVSLELAELNKKYRINKNEIIITTVGSKAEIKESAVGRPIIVAEEGHFLLNQNLVKLTSLQRFDNYFIYSQLLQPRYINYIAAIERGNANQANIAIIDLWQYTFLVPKKLEQQKISMFFKQLDNTIALHQRKLDSLKLMKKGFLQQMFPGKGEKVPRLRFADFPDEWEQCIVSDFTDKTYGGGTPKTNIPEYWTGEIPWIQSSDLIKDDFFNVAPKKHITEDAIRNSSTKLVPSNSITVVTRVGVGKLAFMPFEYATSQDFLSLSNLKVSLIFGVYSLYNMLQKELNNIQGTSIKGITKSDLLEKSITIPVEVEEQKKIGFLFKQLDDIILFHKNKLNQFQALKKAYLQNMFI
ncbi:restriction endonuclease subunit S [Listeria seeligeri]|uniref:restriction endonuclease subunit S n=1 Tax=Listeria seeligeri TaxID=1640 RepID=UPI002F42D328